MESPRTHSVSARDKRPLLDFVVAALRDAGCRILFIPEPNVAPFRITFETPEGERMGIVVYAFFANSKVTTNRPEDEHRFQVKYGAKRNELLDFWQDPYGLYTTLFVGIDPERGIFVGADPVLHSPTKTFISIEFKRSHVHAILVDGWHSWERDRRSIDDPVEVLVGGRREFFLRFVRFEREALGEDQGHRGWLADRLTAAPHARTLPPSYAMALLTSPTPRKRHELAAELQLSEQEVLDLIENAPRLKMAVRGWVAEHHLFAKLSATPGVSDCVALREEGEADIGLVFQGRRVTVECKNVLRHRSADGLARLDFQRTRASKADPCSRYYSANDFDIVAACLHSVTDRWEFKFVRSAGLAAHTKCRGKLASNVRVDDRWSLDPREILTIATAS